MRKINKLLFSILFCLIALQSSSFLFAQKSKTKAKVSIPEWVNAPSSVYPSSSYLTYVGTGSDRKSAELDALQGIASVFGQSIKSETKTSNRITQAKENGLIANSSLSTIDQAMVKNVDIDSLIGVEVNNFWFDEVSSWYAIAVLDKEKATSIYNDMITKNLSTFKTLYSKADPKDYTFENYSIYDFAEEIAAENEKHLQKLSIINYDAANNLKKQCVSSKDVKLKKTELAKNIPIHVIVENDDNGRIEEAFHQAIANLGFRGSYDSNVRYLLISKFSYEQNESSDKKTIRCKYNGDCYILDTTENQQIVPFSVSGRDSHIDYAGAKDKSIKKICQKVSTEYAAALDKFLKEIVVE